MLKPFKGIVTAFVAVFLISSLSSARDLDSYVKKHFKTVKKRNFDSRLIFFGDTNHADTLQLKYRRKLIEKIIDATEPKIDVLLLEGIDSSEAFTVQRFRETLAENKEKVELAKHESEFTSAKDNTRMLESISKLKHNLIVGGWDDYSYMFGPGLEVLRNARDLFATSDSEGESEDEDLPSVSEVYQVIKTMLTFKSKLIKIRNVSMVETIKAALSASTNVRVFVVSGDAHFDRKWFGRKFFRRRVMSEFSDEPYVYLRTNGTKEEHPEMTDNYLDQVTESLESFPEEAKFHGPPDALLLNIAERAAYFKG